MLFVTLYVIGILLPVITSLLIFFQQNKDLQFWNFLPVLVFAAFAAKHLAVEISYYGEKVVDSLREPVFWIYSGLLFSCGCDGFIPSSAFASKNCLIQPYAIYLFFFPWQIFYYIQPLS